MGVPGLGLGNRISCLVFAHCSSLLRPPSFDRRPTLLPARLRPPYQQLFWAYGIVLSELQVSISTFVLSSSVVSTIVSYPILSKYQIALVGSFVRSFTRHICMYWAWGWFNVNSSYFRCTSPDFEQRAHSAFLPGESAPKESS